MSSTLCCSFAKNVTLRSSDGQTFEVEEAAAQVSQTIKRMIEDGCTGSVIPVPNLTGPVLALVIEYFKKHSPPSDGCPTALLEMEIKDWDAKFVAVDNDTLLDLTLAAHYLEIQGLLDLTCHRVADILNDNSVEKIREIFHIKNDFTPEEEAEERSKIQWAFE
ncbi:SKP1-like protein 1A [Corylus avellana]|uniref:SKP1-like protein 1A n=1 Tax=Corylus avellana TaxID=13451 RepID=UPI00286A17E8|nr:SKP1-like protein 1A [Corylus avellana]